MNILFLCTFYHRAMIFYDTIQSLKPLGYRIKVFNAVAKGAVISEKYRGIMGPDVIHCECFNKYDRFIYFYKQKKIYDAVLRKTEFKDCELIHSHTLFNGGWVARRIWKKYRIPYIVTVRNTDLNDFLRVPGFRMIARSIVRNAKGVLFLSSAYESAFLAKCFSKMEWETITQKCAVIPNGVESFWLENKGLPKRLSGNDIRLICVGKIDRNKNMKTVVKVAETLIERNMNVSLTVIGQVVDASVYKILEENPVTTMVPYQTKEELIKYYRNADIFIMPSYTESFGRVYVEAMSQGVPVIYTRGQGFDGLFPEGKVGYSVSADNVSEIISAIESIISRYEQISEQCIVECGRFDWKKIAVQLDTFYKKLE